jgi:hypothetical protein
MGASEATVRRDLSVASDDATDLPSNVTSLGGKSYPDPDNNRGPQRTLQHRGIDRRRLGLHVAEELLHGPQVTLDAVRRGREPVPQHVTTPV